ncbi:C2H2-type zinc finger transcription factor [Mucor lusitanicus]
MFTYNPIQFNNNMNMNINYQPSPAMVTPLLESSNMDTPFLDSFNVSPYLMYASFADTHQQNNNSKDVFIAGYLDGHENSDIAKLTHDPLKFNGDPSVLLIDKSKSPHLSYPRQLPQNQSHLPQLNWKTVTEEDSDSLFPPLNSSQQSMNTDTQSSQDVSLDQLLGFDPSSPLSEDDSDDYVVDEEAQQHQKKEESLKRKASESTAASSSAPSTKKTKTSSAKKGAITVKESKSAKLFQCPLCPHMSKRRYNLSTHMKTHDKNRIKEFNCLHEEFDRRHDRDRHLATVHRGERSYNCSECKSHFSRRDALNRHLVQKHDYDEQDFAE